MPVYVFTILLRPSNGRSPGSEKTKVAGSPAPTPKSRQLHETALVAGLQGRPPTPKSRQLHETARGDPCRRMRRPDPTPKSRHLHWTWQGTVVAGLQGHGAREPTPGASPIAFRALAQVGRPSRQHHTDMLVLLLGCRLHIDVVPQRCALWTEKILPWMGGS